MLEWFQCDRMAADMAIELAPHKVAAVSLWPGAVKTELITKTFTEKPDVLGEKFSPVCTVISSIITSPLIKPPP